MKSKELSPFKWPAHTPRPFRFLRDLEVAAALTGGWWRLRRLRLGCCALIRGASRLFAGCTMAAINMSASSMSISVRGDRGGLVMSERQAHGTRRLPALK